MAIEFLEHLMSVEADGSVVTAATWAGGDQWVAGTWPRYVTRHQAITALPIAERLVAGYGDNDPFVLAWPEELR
jgi:hypothetical protein